MLVGRVLGQRFSICNVWFDACCSIQFVLATESRCDCLNGFLCKVDNLFEVLSFGSSFCPCLSETQHLSLRLGIEMRLSS